MSQEREAVIEPTEKIDGDNKEDAPAEQEVEEPAPERPSIYSPVKNRESFIDRKLRELGGDKPVASFDKIDFKPRLSQIQQEQAALKEKKE